MSQASTTPPAQHLALRCVSFSCPRAAAVRRHPHCPPRARL